MTDAGSGCGANINGLGNNAGFTIVEGHEYAETETDPYCCGSASAWQDASTEEIGDKCEWITSGQGAIANATFSTGTFPVQSLFSNGGNPGDSCVMSWDGWASSLTASPNPALPVEGVTLTATANQDVGPTPYFIEIYDLSTDDRVAVCNSGSTCSVVVCDPPVGVVSCVNGPPSVGVIVPQCRTYVADVASNSIVYAPPNVQTESNRVTVQWTVLGQAGVGGCGT
jgi:hypothetical protein